MASEVSTSAHIDAVMDFAQNELKSRFAMDVDQMAKLNKDRYHHVYEWGDTWETRKDNAGIPAMRLWRLTPTGNGANRKMSFFFKPSLRPSPIHPEEEKRGVEADKHIFTWKAPVMEYGMQIRIEPVEALKDMLVFYWEKIDKVVATKKTIVTRPDPNVRGVFTGHFVMWWSEKAPVIFENEIRPRFEQDIVPRKGGRFAPGRSKAASRALALGGGVSAERTSVTFDTPDTKRGMRDAKKTMKRIAAGYEQGRGGYENHGHE